MFACGVTAIGLAGVMAPNIVLAFLSAEVLVVGSPIVILWKPSNSLAVTVCASLLWVIITLPGAILLMIYAQVYRVGENQW
jgi:hypothetical protein